MLGAGALLVGCPDATEAPAPLPPKKNNIVVVGAGVAGLSCAYCLAKAGAEVSVYEANSRIGGRLLTHTWEQGKEQFLYELGAEFLDPRHVSMRVLAKELGIDLLERRPGPAPSAFWLESGPISREQVQELFALVEASVSSALAEANDYEQQLLDLDNTTLDRWLRLNVRNSSAELSAILAVLLRNRFGVGEEDLSALSLLELVGPAGLDRLEAPAQARTAVSALNGLSEFPARLAERLETENTSIQLNHTLREVRTGATSGFTLVFETESGSGIEVEAEQVVLALPFSTLRNVKLSVPLSNGKRTLLSELRYGDHSKLCAVFSGTDLPAELRLDSEPNVEHVWDAPMDAMNYRVISSQSTNIRLGTEIPNKEQSAALLGERLSSHFGPKSTFVYRPQSAARVRWGNWIYALGSVPYYRPRQWGSRAVAGRRAGNLHFCGDHCSIDFHGTAEGAAETGMLVAAEVLQDAQLAFPAALSDWLILKGRQAQPYLGMGDPGRDVVTRRARAFMEHDQFVSQHLADQLL